MPVRDIFEEAYEFALPFLDPDQGCCGVAMSRHAYVALRERYPQLSAQDVNLLVPALERVFRLRHRPGG